MKGNREHVHYASFVHGERMRQQLALVVPRHAQPYDEPDYGDFAFTSLLQYEINRRSRA